MDNTDSPHSFAARVLKAVAHRFAISMPDHVEADLAAFGVRPRLGKILDHYSVRSHDMSVVADLVVGPYRFSPNDLVLEKDGIQIRLTEKERDILLILVAADTQKVERKTILDKIWGYADGVETHTLETHIYRLRQKIEKDPAKPLILRTDEDGYRLDGLLP